MSKENPLLNHPAAGNTTADIFTYQKTPVIEESVNRNDPQIPLLVAGDITAEDIDFLSNEALRNIDKHSLEFDRDSAVAEAVSMAISSADEGKWQSKVDSSTADIIVDEVNKKLTKKIESKIVNSEDQNDRVMNLQHLYGKKAADGVSVLTQSGALQKASPSAVNTTIQKQPSRARTQIRKMVSKGTPVVILSSLIKRLDGVADQLQSKNAMDHAAGIDSVTNTLEELSKEKEQ